MEARGKINAYACENKACGKKTHTINLNAGTTPFVSRCAFCGSTATSEMYSLRTSPIPPHRIALTVLVAWYRPTREEFDRSDKYAQEHILNGGLVNALLEDAKPIKDEVDPKWEFELFQDFAEKTFGLSTT